MSKHIIIASAVTAALVTFIAKKHSRKRDAAADRVAPFGEFVLFTLLH
jgi:hypothetical protein